MNNLSKHKFVPEVEVSNILWHLFHYVTFQVESIQILLDVYTATDQKLISYILEPFLMKEKKRKKSLLQEKLRLGTLFL